MRISSRGLLKNTKIKSLPTTLEESVHALEKDPIYLIQNNVFDKVMISEWITAERAEDLEIRSKPHRFEIEKYFDF